MACSYTVRCYSNFIIMAIRIIKFLILNLWKRIYIVNLKWEYLFKNDQTVWDSNGKLAKGKSLNISVRLKIFYETVTRYLYFL